MNIPSPFILHKLTLVPPKRGLNKKLEIGGKGQCVGISLNHSGIFYFIYFVFLFLLLIVQVSRCCVLKQLASFHPGPCWFDYFTILGLCTQLENSGTCHLDNLLLNTKYMSFYMIFIMNPHCCFYIFCTRSLLFLNQKHSVNRLKTVINKWVWKLWSNGSSTI